MLARVMAAPPSQVASQDVETLLDILREDVNLAVWQRPLSPAVEQFAQAVVASGTELADTCHWAAPADGSAGSVLLPGVAKAAGQLPGFAQFVEDVDYLVSLFACLLDARSVGVRLRTLDKAMCPRWHVDKVPLRLVASYAGPGSEWLSERRSPRAKVGSPSVDQCSESGVAQGLDCGHVALLKGER